MQDFMYFINAKCIYSGTQTETAYAKLIPITAIDPLVITEYNTPLIRSPFVYIDEDGFNFIIDPYKTLQSVNITYFKRPLKLTSGTPTINSTNTPEVLEDMHAEIVAVTVNLLLENLESPRVQTNEVQLSRKE